MKEQREVIFKDSVFLQEVDGETILLDGDTEEYFSLNETAGYIYKTLQSESDLEKAIKTLGDYFEISSLQIESDVLNFVEILGEKGLLEIN